MNFQNPDVLISNVDRLTDLAVMFGMSSYIKICQIRAILYSNRIKDALGVIYAQIGQYCIFMANIANCLAST